MLVKNWMSRPVITVDAKSSIQEAGHLLAKHNIRILPVMNRKALVGIISDRDLKRSSASDATCLDKHELLYLLSKIQVREIMTANPICVHPDDTIETAAKILMEHKISGVPVIGTNEELVGIITQSDLYRVLINLTGVDRRGLQFSLQVPDRPKSVIGIKDIIHEYGGRIVSLLSSYENAPPGYRNLYIRVYHIDRGVLSRLQSELKKEASLLYMVDKQPREKRNSVGEIKSATSQIALSA